MFFYLGLKSRTKLAHGKGLGKHRSTHIFDAFVLIRPPAVVGFDVMADATVLEVTNRTLERQGGDTQKALN